MTAFQPVQGDPAVLARVFADTPELWLPDGVRLGEDRWQFVVHGAGFSRTVVGRLGEPWNSSTTLWRAISWEPVRESDADERPARLLPSFDGELGVFSAGGGTSLALEGSYRPPGGPLGAALDGLALHRVARGTAERLLADVAACLVAAAEPESSDAAPSSGDRHRG